MDDILVGGTDEEAVAHIKRSLKGEFEIEDLGEVKEVLGMKISQTDDGIYISQPKHIRQLLEQVNLEDINEQDVQAALDIAKNPCNFTKMKHVELRHLFVRENVQDQTVQVIRCKSDDMIAEMFTKSLNLEKFTKFRSALYMKDDPVSTRQFIINVRTAKSNYVTHDARCTMEYLPWEDSRTPWTDLYSSRMPRQSASA